MEELICREGTVHSVIFQNAENGYTVLRLLTEEGEVVTVVGCIPCVAPGEHLTVTGTWEVHPQHGEQLKAQELERTLPEEEEEIFAYLSSGVCKGVGPTTARRIVDRFGLETLDILEAEPERLQEIRGITGAGHPAAAAVWGRGHPGGGEKSLSAVGRCVRRGFFRDGHHGAVHGICRGLHGAP